MRLFTKLIHDFFGEFHLILIKLNSMRFVINYVVNLGQFNITFRCYQQIYSTSTFHARSAKSKQI